MRPDLDALAALADAWEDGYLACLDGAGQQDGNPHRQSVDPDPLGQAERGGGE